MKAVLFDGKGSVRLGEVPKPKLLAGKDAIVRITHAAICGSDLNILKGKIVLEKDGIMGHEGAGVVEEVGPDVKKYKPGDRVVLSYTVQCGECASCRDGLFVFCEHGGMFGHGAQWGGHGGAHAEYLRIPFADAVLEPIPDGLTEEQVLFVGDILSTGYMASEYGSIKPGDVVAVFGAGPVGLCTVAAARLWGPSVLVSVDTLDYRLEAAKRLGADVTINAARTNAAEEIKKMTGGKGCDVAIEAVGSAETLDGCLGSVKGGGNISIVGVFPFAKEMSIRQILRQQLQIRAGRANVVHMARLMSLIGRGKLDLTPLITHRMPLADAVEAYRIFGSRSENVIKVILNP